MRITVRKCDGCGQLIERKSEAYEIHMIGKSTFWDGTETSERIKELDFCERCAVILKESLEIIVKRKQVRRKIDNVL